MLFDDDVESGPYDRAENSARRAYELYEDGKMAQALVELEQALEINPTNSAWRFNKGLTLDAINQFQEAIVEYETALELTPDDLEILNALAVDYTRVGLYDRALQTFEYVQGLDPKFEPCYCNRIITYAEMGQHDMAEQMFYLAQQIDEDCALCYYNIGNSLFARGEFKKAVRCWVRTADLEPTHPQINYRIAQAYWSDGDPARARAALPDRAAPPTPAMSTSSWISRCFSSRPAISKPRRRSATGSCELNPDFAPALFYLGEMTLDQGDSDRAAGLFEEALKRDATLAGPHYRMAQCLLATQQHEKVKAHLLAELEREIEDANALISMASMFLTIKDPEHATQCLLRAVGLDMRSADAYHYLGVTAANQGQLVDADRFLAHALDLNPKHTGACGIPRTPAWPGAKRRRPPSGLPRPVPCCRPIASCGCSTTARG